MDEVLKEQYEFKADDRYHCKHCDYDTQLPNAAFRHFQKKHAAEVEKARKQKKSAPKAEKIDQEEKES